MISAWDEVDWAGLGSEREFFIDNLLARIHFIIVMIRWTGLAPWEFEFPFPGSLTSTFLMIGRFPLPATGTRPGWALRSESVARASSLLYYSQA